ncbi:MAG TPA: hypothetical protein VFG04_01275 [Planctomycetaceae bacterium]|jgi:hypothetical protein|nr:hypothetical protein [Planctomycetaceae bacterium]
MKTQPELTRTHRRTYETVFAHPAAHNLEWRDLRGLLNELAEVEEEPNGKLKITRNGQTLSVQPDRHKDVAEVEELMRIRHFLERSNIAESPPDAEGHHLLVVIDHREARIFKADLKGSVPERITPFDPQGLGRHLHSVTDDSNGQRLPERKSFYEDVAKCLRGAEQILLFGTGTGASSAMEQLRAELKQHHADVAKHIVGSVAVDEHHLTEDQLLARAREFYGSATEAPGA